MTYFLKSGTRYNVTSKESMDLHETLPVGTYTVKIDPRTEALYIEAIEDFTLPPKIYGNATRNAERILNTFWDRKSSTGVLLTGEKGGGKTLLAQKISIDARERDVPTIVINTPLAGEGFNSFMQQIEQPVIVIFDEFEKVYDREDQEKMLTLLDGVYQSKKLFILTSNEKYRVNQHMRNRPGRLFYSINYTGLEGAFIQEYCEDVLINQEHIPAIHQVAMMFSAFNFDMLKALIEEMNRYNESPHDSLALLNSQPDADQDSVFNVKLQMGGVELDENHLKTWEGTPFDHIIAITYSDDEVDSDEDVVLKYELFTVTDLKKIDEKSESFIYHNKKGNRLELTRRKPTGFKWGAY